MENSPSWEANRFEASQEIPPHFMESGGSLLHSQMPTACPYPEPLWTVRNMILFYGEELLAPRPTTMLEDSLFGCPKLLIQYICSYPSR
jgi:hypothetical protein